MPSTIHNFNNDSKSWKMHAYNLESISGDDLNLTASNNKNIYLNVSGGLVNTTYLDVSNNLRVFGNAVFANNLLTDNSSVKIPNTYSNYAFASHNNLLTNLTKTGNTWIDLSGSGYIVNYSPLSNNSKLLLHGNINYIASAESEQFISFQLLRIIDGSETILFNDMSFGSVFGTIQHDIYTFSYLDSPDTSSNITYYLKYQINDDGNNIDVSSGVLGYDNSNINCLMVQELYIPSMDGIIQTVNTSLGNVFQDNKDASFNNVDICGTLNSMLVFDVSNKRINPASPDNNGVINLGYKEDSSDRARFNEIHTKRLICNTTQINADIRFYVNNETLRLDTSEDGTGGTFEIKTREDGEGGSLTEKLRVNNIGAIGIGGANYGTSGQVLTSNGSNAAVTWNTISDVSLTNYSDASFGNVDISGNLELQGDVSFNSNVDISGYLKIDGSDVIIIPSQTSNSGKYLTTDGNNLSWGAVSGGSDISLLNYSDASFQNVDISGNLVVSNGTIDNMVIGGTTAAAGSFTTLNTSNDLIVDTSLVYAKTSQSKVGIGTNDPKERLHIVNSDGDVYTRIQCKSAYKSGIKFGEGSTINYTLYYEGVGSQNSLHLTNEAGDELFKTRQANIEIGSLNNPDTKTVTNRCHLEVDKSLTVTGDTSLNSNVDISGYLKIDGSDVIIIPSQTNNSGKYLTTDGNNLSWGTVSSGGGGSDISLLNYSDASFGNVDICGTLNSMLVFDFANKRINPASPDNNGVINLGYKNSSSDRARFNEVHLKELFTTKINNYWRYRLYSDPTYSSDPFIIYSDQNGTSKFFSIDISGISTFGDGVNVSNYLKIDGSNVAIKDDVDASFALYTLTSDLYNKTELQSGNLDLSFNNVDICGTLNSMLVFDFANKRINPVYPDNDGKINLGYKDQSSRARFNKIYTKRLICNTPEINEDIRFYLNNGTETLRLDTSEDGINGGNFVIKTKEDGGGLTEKIRVNNIGAIGIGGANYGDSGAILTSNGSTSSISWNRPYFLAVRLKNTYDNSGSGPITFTIGNADMGTTLLSPYDFNNSDWSEANNRWTCPKTGIYRISAQIMAGSDDDDVLEKLELIIRKELSVDIARSFYNLTGNSGSDDVDVATCNITIIQQFDVTDIVELRCFYKVNSGNLKIFGATNEDKTFMTIERII